jgi:hypothetical protein
MLRASAQDYSMTTAWHAACGVDARLEAEENTRTLIGV